MELPITPVPIQPMTAFSGIVYCMDSDFGQNYKKTCGRGIGPRVFEQIKLHLNS
jgi:hypothetical protein